MSVIINKKVFVGIDVHKKNYFVTAVIDNNVVKRDTIPGDPNYLVAYLKKNLKMRIVILLMKQVFQVLDYIIV